MFDKNKIGCKFLEFFPMLLLYTNPPGGVDRGSLSARGEHVAPALYVAGGVAARRTRRPCAGSTARGGLGGGLGGHTGTTRAPHPSRVVCRCV